MNAKSQSTGFTRALNCLSKYGEDLIISASPEALSFSAASSSFSAYCRFKFHRHFFSRYKFSDENPHSTAYDDKSQVNSVAVGQLLTKVMRAQLFVKVSSSLECHQSLLSILKHRNVEKSVNSCELIFTDGGDSRLGQNDDENEDSLESRLIVRLRCKHGKYSFFLNSFHFRAA